MWRLDDLPLHPLLVHAPVVLVPLVAAGLVLNLCFVPVRKVLGPVVAFLAVTAAAAAIVSATTGDQLADALRLADAADGHRSWGMFARLTTVLVALGATCLAALTRRADRRRWPTETFAAVVLTVSLAATVGVSAAGHTGARLAWKDRVPDETSSPTSIATTATGATVTGASTPMAPPPPTDPAQPAVAVVLGEWALVTDVPEAPPGPVTFRIRNAGARVHTLRIRSEGSGRDRFEWRSERIDPGETITATVDLAADDYELTCSIEDDAGDHGDLGMEQRFAVRGGAPQITAAPLPPTTSTAGATGATQAQAAAVEIRAFAYQPATITVTRGSSVTWTNADPAPHTATGDGFDTGNLAQGQRTAIRFDRAGDFPYICTIHPAMTGTVVVT